MVAAWRWGALRGLLLTAPLWLLACSSLIGLGELQKADCVDDCDAAGTAGSAPGGTGTDSAGSSATSAHGGMPGLGGKAGASSGGNFGGVASVAGANTAGTAPSVAGGESGGSAGGPPAVEVCPGGPEPDATWTEHWFDHNQKLSRVYYDDCIALYFDADTDMAAKDWLIPFLDNAWAYSLKTYGKLGNERIYVVVHQGRHFGGHSSTFVEASHDSHAVIDMGANDWLPGEYDVPAHLLSFLVDTEGAHSKFGAPKSNDYDNEGFPLIYKYDLYAALGLTSEAKTALSDFNAISNDQPYADTYWFRDWFYPVWRDHGHAAVFANYQTLLEKYFPAGADLWMPDMNYGQYFHFMSGAAGVDLVPLAREAFEWHPDFDDELAAAKVAFPDIKY